MRLSPPLQSTRLWYLKQYLVAISIACLMIGATFLPWVVDTLGGEYSAWKLPVDIDWQFHAAAFSYGLLCVLCAALVLFRIFRHWRLRYDTSAQAQYCIVITPIGWLCLFPVLLLVFQYLFADVYGIDVLAQHEIQMLLIQQQFGYNVLNQVLTLVPFTTFPTNYGATVISGTTLGGRFILVLDELGPGMLLPLMAGITALIYSNYSGAVACGLKPVVPLKQRIKKHQLALLLSGLFLLIVFGRAPFAMLCEYQAKQALSIGDYRGAISWLQRAVTLNPALAKLAVYHNERGRADYYLQPSSLTDDAHTYLASVYTSENDYRDAFSELQLVGDANSSNEGRPWLTEQLSMTLEWLAEFTATHNGAWHISNNTTSQQSASNPGLPQASSQLAVLNALQNSNQIQQTTTTYALAPVVQGNNGSLASLFWLTTLSQIDSSNVYARYALGRAFYAQGGYAACIDYMQQVLDANPNTDVQSSADTYIALSMIEQGEVAQARQLLLQAVKLDPDFNNNTAREQLSGLH